MASLGWKGLSNRKIFCAASITTRAMKSAPKFQFISKVLMVSRYFTLRALKEGVSLLKFHIEH
jgi:hypothetical protein